MIEKSSHLGAKTPTRFFLEGVRRQLRVRDNTSSPGTEMGNNQCPHECKKIKIKRWPVDVKAKVSPYNWESKDVTVNRTFLGTMAHGSQQSPSKCKILLYFVVMLLRFGFETGSHSLVLTWNSLCSQSYVQTLSNLDSALRALGLQLWAIIPGSSMFWFVRESNPQKTAVIKTVS